MDNKARAMVSDQEEWAKCFHTDQSIMAGVDEDLERVIFLVFDEFEKTSGPRFKTFIEIWHRTNFGLIFCGREKFREMFEFTEEMLNKVKKYAMSSYNKKPNNQLVRFAAIYMLYALYFKQPCRPRVPIRVVTDELEDLLATVELARQEKHWDVRYAWCKLFTSHAFHYTAHPVQLGLEVALQMEQREAAERNREPEKENYFRSKEYLGLMKKLNKAHTKYANLKNNLASPSNPGDTSLYLTDSSFPVTLRKMVGSTGEGKKQEKNKNEIGDKRRGLKYKFYEGVGEDEAAALLENKKKTKKTLDDGDWVPGVETPSKRGKGIKRKRGKIGIKLGGGSGKARKAKSSKPKQISFMSDNSDENT